MAVIELCGLCLLALLYVGLESLPTSSLPSEVADIPTRVVLEDEFALLRLGAGEQQKSAAVVFVHGHMGHPTQAFPLASVLQDADVDIYAVDFNECAVALSHFLFQREVAFLHSTFSYLSAQYRKLALVGHSMGGVVAASALSTYGNFSSVKVLVALSSPLELHPINTDWEEQVTYAKMHDFWKRKKTVPIVSIAGGARDLMIPAQLTAIGELLNRDAHHIYTTQLRGLGDLSDHLAITGSPDVLAVVRTSVQHYLFDPSSPLSLQGLLSPLASFFHSERDCAISAAPMSLPVDTLSLPVRSKRDRLISLEAAALVAAFSNASVHVVRARSPGLASVCELERFEVGQAQVSIVSLGQRELLWAGDEMCIVPVQQVAVNGSVLGLATAGEVVRSEYGVLRIGPIPAAANPRFALRLHVSSPSLVFAECSSESLSFVQAEDAVLWLHEYCAGGPTVWVLSQSHSCDFHTPVTVTITIDAPASAFLHFVDFRLTIWSFAIFGFIVPLGKGRDGLVWAAVVSLLWTSSNVLRGLGLLSLDHVHFVEVYRLGVLDVAFLLVVSQTIVSLMGAALRVVLRAAGSVPKLRLSSLTCKRLICASALLSVLCPFASLLPLLIVLLPHVSLPNQLPLLRVSIAHFLLCVPQFIGWGMSLAFHGHWEVADVHATVAVISIHVGLYALVNLRSDESITAISTCAGTYIGLCGFDLLYRANIALTLCQLAIGLSTASKPKLTSN